MSTRQLETRESVDWVAHEIGAAITRWLNRNLAHACEPQWIGRYAKELEARLEPIGVHDLKRGYLRLALDSASGGGRWPTHDEIAAKVEHYVRVLHAKRVASSC